MLCLSSGYKYLPCCSSFQLAILKVSYECTAPLKKQYWFTLREKMKY